MRGTVGVAPSTTTLTLPDGSAVALADWIDDKLYGSAEFSNGDTAPIEVFSAGRSQAIPGGARVQTRVDTNIPRNGDSGLPKDWSMLVYGIGVKMVRVHRGTAAAPATGVLADGAGALSNVPTMMTLFQFDRVTFLAFEYNGKIYSNGVLQNYPQGHGYHVFSTNAAFELCENGVPSPRDRISMVLPIWMRENNGYKMIFQPEAALIIAQLASDGGNNLTMIDVKVELNGLIKRTVV